MNNRDIASVLKNIALFADLAGENPFKVRAFEQASRIVASYPGEIAQVARSRHLTEISGIGKGVAEVIAECVESGKSSLLETLRSSFPEHVPELLELPGMGPKKVKTVWEKLGISNVGELEYACRENRLLVLEGFGAKTQQKILDGIERRKRYRDTRLISEAYGIGRQVMEELEGSGLFSKVRMAGSMRRGNTVFTDIDLLLVPAPGAADERVNAALTGLAEADMEEPDCSVPASQPGSVTIRRRGIRIEFRIVPERSFPSALQLYTGSRDHNALLRSRAERMGIAMNRQGDFDQRSPHAAATEEEVYTRLGLSFIPPEIREAAGEIEAAERGEIPPLVTARDVKGMIHVHSSYSDGVCGLRTLAEECIRLGYSYLCVSDHSRSAFYANGLSEERLLAQRSEVEALGRELAPFRIFCGVESDILTDGGLDYPEHVLGTLDFVIGSIHSRLSMDPSEATVRLLKAIDNPFLTILGHISGRLLLSRDGYGYDEDRILEALARRSVVLEHNCNPHRLDPDWPFLKKAAASGIPVSLGPDAHSLEGFADMEYGLIMARKGWITPGGILNCLTTEEIDEYFRRRKKEKGL
jgi:DNA polymerase (family 10)